MARDELTARELLVERLVAEQHNNRWWTAKGRLLFRDHPVECEHRRREAVAESEEYERKRRGRK